MSSINNIVTKPKNKNIYFKILMLSDDTNKNEKSMLDERQGKMLLHTEYSLLSLLNDQDGVIHHHGMFSVRFLINSCFVHFMINIF